jgi:hypothetical protein
MDWKKMQGKKLKCEISLV